MLRKIRRTPLFRIASLNGLSVVIKIVVGLASSKIIAVFVGPAGMALVGNLRNFTTSAESLATLGLQNGIVKYVAENSEKREKLREILSTVFIALACVGVVLSSTLYFLADYWSKLILDDSDNYGIVFKILAIALPWSALSVFGISVINGLGKYKKVILITISGNILGLIVTATLILWLHTMGALLSIIIAPSLLLLVTLLFLNKEIAILGTISVKYFNFGMLRNLSFYSLMTFVPVIIGPIVYLAIRNHLIDSNGVEAAGYWEAITRISTYYLMFITTLLTVYYLPKLALAQNDNATKKIFFNYYRGVLPYFILGAIVIYIFREFIISLLFTAEFSAVSDLFIWQLLGDVFKAASLILGYQFFAKNLIKAFIVTEMISFAVLYFSSIFAVTVWGLEGVVMAYFFTYFVYLLVLVVYFRRLIFA